MPLQNRVDPFGAIHAVPERGMFTGNRGIIHDPETKTLKKKRWALQAWIICVCQFRNVRREPMGRNRKGGKAGWTELFFLDEVTALAAGHRPCFFCQRERAKDFVGCFGEAFGIAEPRAPMVDRRLHKERLASGGRSIPLAPETLAGLPDGTMISSGNKPYALSDGYALPWSFGGYQTPISLAALQLTDPFMITPPTSVAVLRTGYRPVWAS
ncbi:hypothetical protein EN943_10895 [Mesorhizobium sp. M7A.F.Ca.US.006.01.1.1]|uniref:hypothetical protein n=1 Tax=Mesorhizobium sp. M7A.F.Ca.US.006.01.1.1 TaxID=2496707 RepID=UPI000FCAB5F3|nr:hypothetical protein [Mesorhizobium sp. M7A.F.Ca.US.006.01.1.1]RUZ78360.1 hypothetical protein EN943_10895 [Mesorhizobium sp. M7A.F.Ca.US.006.01.1.1]